MFESHLKVLQTFSGLSVSLSTGAMLVGAQLLVLVLILHLLFSLSSHGKLLWLFGFKCCRSRCQLMGEIARGAGTVATKTRKALTKRPRKGG